MAVRLALRPAGVPPCSALRGRVFSGRCPLAMVEERVTASRSSAIGGAAVAQLVECVLGKDEVMGSIPISSFCGRAVPGGEVAIPWHRSTVGHV